MGQEYGDGKSMGTGGPKDRGMEMGTEGQRQENRTKGRRTGTVIENKGKGEYGQREGKKVKGTETGADRGKGIQG